MSKISTRVLWPPLRRTIVGPETTEFEGGLSSLSCELTSRLMAKMFSTLEGFHCQLHMIPLSFGYCQVPSVRLWPAGQERALLFRCVLPSCNCQSSQSIFVNFASFVPPSQELGHEVFCPCFSCGEELVLTEAVVGIIFAGPWGPVAGQPLHHFHL